MNNSYLINGFAKKELNDSYKGKLIKKFNNDNNFINILNSLEMIEVLYYDFNESGGWIYGKGKSSSHRLWWPFESAPV